MNELVLPLLLIANAASASETSPNDATASAIVAYDERAARTDPDATSPMRVIGTTTSVAALPLTPFALDFRHALTPLQMNEIYDREIDRVFSITHSP
ncbi:MAG: hypothetical protein NVS2B3_04180 [Vulcanimicrobiaceae bacterium]